MNWEPIYIGGLDRSGKTLMRLALSAHPHIAMTRRTYMWQRYYRRFGNLDSPRNLDRCLQAMLKRKSIRFLEPDEERIRSEFAQGETTYPRLFALFHQHYAERFGKTRWGEQSGLIESFASEIIQAYPRARLIHMIRDPRNRSEEILLSSTQASRPGKIGAMTASWLYSIHLARRNQKLYPDQVKVLRFEDLLRKPVETLKDVCQFIGEEFSPGMVTLENSIPMGIAPKAAIDTQKLWENEVIDFDPASQRCLTRRENSFLHIFTRKAMLELGYADYQPELSLSERLRYFIDLPVNMVRFLSWRPLEASKYS